MKADFHIHSTFSDGSFEIDDIVRLSKEKMLDAIAITDHDTIAHFDKMPKSGDLTIIPAVEISAIHRETKTEAHVLGYRLEKPSIISELTMPLLERRNRNSERQVDVLTKNGYSIELSKLARAEGKYLYKVHIVDWLVQTGQVPELFGGFYASTFKNGGICDFSIEYIDVFDAVKAIKEAGGLAVLAHPGQQANFWLIPALFEQGLDGVELNHPVHSENDFAAVRELSGRFNLFMTGGSDFHGKFTSRQDSVGDFLSDESGMAALLN